MAVQSRTMEGMAALLVVLVLVGGLAWCRYVPEADRMYHWGLACAGLLLFGLVDLAIEIVRRL